ncbi:DUF1043 domain-containing protein [Marinomonas sp.]|nr:DUF1043 domain-containing protein [Marinomonas sp.]MDB4837963.1 DUF1043 domain-containing protein [Marinomonas sp.]
MNLEEFNIIIFITGVIFGCIATSAFKNLASKNTKKSNNLPSDIVTMTSLQQEIDSKQVVIDNFFNESNEQVAALEKQLTTLKSSLTDNAKALNVSIESNLIESTEPVEAANTTMPPLDYAPKAEETPGMLSETFGLDGKDSELEPKRGL